MVIARLLKLPTDCKDFLKVEVITELDDWKIWSNNYIP